MERRSGDAQKSKGRVYEEGGFLSGGVGKRVGLYSRGSGWELKEVDVLRVLVQTEGVLGRVFGGTEVSGKEGESLP